GTRSEQAQQHLQQMLRLGLPTRKHENWKYTPLDGLLNAEFVTRLADLTPAQRDALALRVDAVRLVFVDGQFRPELSDTLQESSLHYEINADRWRLGAHVQPEVTLH
ncbi:signal peptide peptidase SppA, partial [Enterobacter cloacae]|nr:signal peptide peptidase SppA [Enterobacter cloacae]